jgi:hypothetical protein
LENKESVLDMKAEDETGRIFDVEIQVIGSSRYIKRTLYYWAKKVPGTASGGKRDERSRRCY